MMFHLSGFWKTDDLFTIAAVKKHTTTPNIHIRYIYTKESAWYVKFPPLQHKLINSKV